MVFKAGPGPLAEVGKLGVKGKTPCDGCPCMKPERVKAMEALKTWSDDRWERLGNYPRTLPIPGFSKRSEAGEDIFG